MRNLCIKCEDSKVDFVRGEGLDVVIEALQKYPEDPEVVNETCQTIRAVTAVDDLRKDFSSAHNHTRALVSKVRDGSSGGL